MKGMSGCVLCEVAVDEAVVLPLFTVPVAFSSHTRYSPSLLDVQALSPSRPSATLSPPFLLYLTQAFLLFINLCTSCYEPSPQSLPFLRHLLPDHHRFLRSFSSPPVYFSFLSVYLSITWLQQFDSQSQPRRAFPVILLLTGQYLLPPLSPFR
jgi:hypothetical protein